MAFWDMFKKEDTEENAGMAEETTVDVIPDGAENVTAENDAGTEESVSESQEIIQEDVPVIEAETVEDTPRAEEPKKSKRQLRKEEKERKKAEKAEKKAKKKPITGFGVFVLVLFINAVWVAAAVFYFFPMYNDDIWERESQIEVYEEKIQSLQAVYDNMVKEYDAKIEELENRLEAQEQRYIDAIKLIEKYELKLEEERLAKEAQQQTTEVDPSDSTGSENPENNSDADSANAGE